MTQAAKLAQLGSPGISTGFKNRIINGAMMVHQRGGTITATDTANTYGLDRFAMRTTAGSAVVSMQQSTTAPTGFYNSLLCTVTTADASLGANDLTNLFQNIEGLNVADLGWGTANAQTVTVSFKVRSSVTGTYGVGIQNASGNRSYPTSYTINAANTWETKTVTIPGDTTGTWNLGTTSTALYLWFSLGCGSDRAGTAGSWAAADYRGTIGQVNWCATLSNTFYITGVQLEVGTTATDFEYRDYGRELMLCQRYYEKSYNPDVVPGTSTDTGRMFSSGNVGATTTNYITCQVQFKVSKRASPTITIYDTAGNVGKTTRLTAGIGSSTNSNGAANSGGTENVMIESTSGSNHAQIAFHYISSAEL